jgi:lysozyme family protein
MPESFTQADLDAAIAAATSDLQKRLEELGAQVRDTEVGHAVTEAVAAKDTEVAELQSKLDAAEAARTAAEHKFSESEQFWTDAVASAQQEAEAAARREQRVAAAKAAGVLADSYVDENADRFAAMADEEFNARLDEWRAIANAAGVKTGGIPSSTALEASRATEDAPVSALAYIGEFRRQRVDPSALTGGA